MELLKTPSSLSPQARWCSRCSKAHAGAVALIGEKCEGCGLKAPSIGLPAEGTKKRWCRGCAPGAAPQRKKPKAAGPPLTSSDLRASARSRDRLAMGNPYRAAAPSRAQGVAGARRRTILQREPGPARAG